MELVSTRTERGVRPGRVRLVGEVRYDDRDRTRERYWFDVPEPYAASLSDSGNPWLTWLLPLAVTIGEPVRLCRPVDAALLANAARLMQIWTGWYPRLRSVPIEAAVLPPDSTPPPSETAAFFSGGIDSFFTVLRNREADDRAESPAIDRLILVRGFDIDVDNETEFERLRSRLCIAARELGHELIDVATNVRQLRFMRANWGWLAHGSALASIGLALETRFRAVYIATSYTGGLPPHPWGSHPETDPLSSTSRTRIIHDSPGISRFRKTRYVARSAAAMRSLHVCARARSSENCGDCRKCYLTMLTLEVIGALSRCETLARSIDLERVRRIYAPVPSTQYVFREIQLRAREAGRPDIADAIQALLDGTNRLKRSLAIPDWLESKRGLWRLGRAWRRAALAGFIQ